MKKEIESIKARNQRVELDKAWEISYTRRIIITVMTYIVIVIFLVLIKAPYPFLSALVPAIGFFLSTLTLPFFRKWWMNDAYKK